MGGSEASFHRSYAQDFGFTWGVAWLIWIVLSSGRFCFGML